MNLVWQDLFGWGRYVWLLPVAGIGAARRFPKVWLVASVFPSLVLVYLAYWVSGPRYFYEGLYSLTILSGAALAWLAGWMPGQPSDPPRHIRIRQTVVLVGLILLVLFGTLPYTPERLTEIKNRYGFSQVDLAPFDTPEAKARTPALVIIHAPDWLSYGAYLHLQDPYLTSPFIFAWTAPGGDPSASLSRHYPDRTIYHYYPDLPGEFFSKPVP